MAEFTGCSVGREDMSEGDLRRVQLDFPPLAFERLQQLKSETEAASYAEVIKNALKYYAAAVEFQKNGTIEPSVFPRIMGMTIDLIGELANREYTIDAQIMCVCREINCMQAVHDTLVAVKDGKDKP
jgi:hypothetical protein